MTILQRDSGVSISDIRVVFEQLIRKFPVMEIHLSAASSIIMSEDFENGVVKCFDGRSLHLTSSEKTALKPFEKEIVTVDTPYMPSSFPVDVLKCKKT